MDLGSEHLEVLPVRCDFAWNDRPGLVNFGLDFEPAYHMSETFRFDPLTGTSTHFGSVSQDVLDSYPMGRRRDVRRIWQQGPLIIEGVPCYRNTSTGKIVTASIDEGDGDIPDGFDESNYWVVKPSWTADTLTSSTQRLFFVGDKHIAQLDGDTIHLSRTSEVIDKEVAESIRLTLDP